MKKELMEFGRFSILVSVLVATVGCSCVTIVSPVPTTQAWYAAKENMDIAKMYELIHPDRQNALQQCLTQPAGILLRATGLQNVKYINLVFKIVSQDQESATVQVTGKFTNTLGLLFSVDETVQLKKHDHQWMIWSFDDLLCDPTLLLRQR